MGTKLSTFSKKIVLGEIDLKQLQVLWFNYTANVWYVDFENIYERIAATFLFGSYVQAISRVGSIFVDGVAILSVASEALVISTNLSFYFNVSHRRLFIHLDNGNEPSLYSIKLGVTSGVSNIAGVYDNVYYEPRILRLPVITKSKDPLFYGRVAMSSGVFAVNNDDGAYDHIGENQSALFGSEFRLLQGFDDDAYASFTRMATRMVQNCRITRDGAEFDVLDKRTGLSVSVPYNVFSSTVYPDIELNDIGKPIPLTYGIIYKAPVVCTNQLEAGGPAQYHFKAADTTGAGHSIQSIDYVYVKGISVAFSNVSLANATFDVASGVYTPGDEVWVSMHGFTDGVDLITNAADIILDLLNTWLGIAYIAANFNLVEWAAVTALLTATFPGGIGLFIDSPTEVWAIAEQICASCALNLIPQDDGKFTLRMYDAARAVSQVFDSDEIMGTPSYEYDASQVISYTNVGYAQTWHNGNYRHLMDMTQDAAIFAIYNKHKLGTFETLLTTAADAQTFSTLMLSVQGAALRKFTLRFKMQPFDREVMDFIDANLMRISKMMLGWVRAEVLSKTVTASKEVVLGCRIVQNL